MANFDYLCDTGPIDTYPNIKIQNSSTFRYHAALYLQLCDITDDLLLSVKIMHNV